MRIRLKRSVDIQVPPETVFQLVMDLEKRIRLNPNVDEVSVEPENKGPVRVGTVFHVRLKSHGQIIDYRCRLSALEPGRLLEITSLTGRPFGMRVRVEPVPGGARLTHEEWLAFEYEEPPRSEAGSVLGKLAQVLANGLSGQAAEDRLYQTARFEEELDLQLKQWLKATKADLEKSAGTARPSP